MKVERGEEIFFCVWEVPLASSISFEWKSLILTDAIPQPREHVESLDRVLEVNRGISNQLSSICISYNKAILLNFCLSTVIMKSTNMAGRPIRAES